MELEGPDVSGKSVDVDGRKRLYSFDDLDDEPPVQPKLRRFTSQTQSSRLQGLSLKVTEERDEDTDNRSVLSKESCVAANKENVTSVSVSNKSTVPYAEAGCGTTNEQNENTDVLVKFSEADSQSETNQNRPDDLSTTAKIGNDSVISGPAQSQEWTIHKQVSGQVLDSDGCHRVLYVHSQQLIQHCNQLPRIPARVCNSNGLIK